MKITLTDEITELKREIAMRESVYPGLVRARKLTSEEMFRRLACSRATLARLEAMVPQQTSLFG